jgi:L-aspartate oxidase
LRERFPNIFEFLENYQLDLSIDLIPVSPSAHYWMGGVKTDLHGGTSIPGLYAAGEVACTGVHGANRLASNSLLEGLVFGARAGEAMSQENNTGMENELPARQRLAKAPEVLATRKRIQEENWKHLGLIRNASGIEELLSFLGTIETFTPSNLPELELLNLLQCSKLMGASALKREESRGSHYREDFPERNVEWNGSHSIVRNGQIEIAQI